jgi:hypothetical protein
MHQINCIRRQLREYLPWHGARLAFLAMFIVALFKARTVNLAELAIVMPSRKTVEANSKRIYRFFRSFEFEQATVTKALVKMLNPPQPWTLSIDRTNWSFGTCHINILCLGVVYRGIAIPLVWTMLEKRGNSNSEERMDLLNRFIAQFPEVKVKYLTADREFIGTAWFSYLMMSPAIPMLIRIKENFQISSASGKTKKAASDYFRDLAIGHSRLLSKPRWVCRRRLWVHATRLPDNQLLILVTQKRPATPLTDYAQRWGIETLFGVFKTRGFCLESTHFRDRQRLSKLIALLSLAVVWALKTGLWLHQRKPILLKKHGYKAKSFFRYGFDFLRRIFSNPYFAADDFSFALRCLGTASLFCPSS